MRRLRTILSVLTAVTMLAAMLCMTVLPANAAVTPPGHPYWDGFVARWEAPDNETVQYYRLYLYKDGGEIKMEFPEDVDCDFESVIKSYGTGSYQFSVATAIGNDQEDTSEFVYSNTFSYDSSSEHTLIQYPFKYPGCTTAGDKGHYECTHCGKWFWDATAQNEITDRNDVITEPIGHDWGEWVTTKEAAQTENGLAERVCKNDPSHKEQKVIPRLDGGASGITSETAAPDATAASTEAVSADASQLPSEQTGATVPELNEQAANALVNLFGGWFLTVIIIAAAAILLIVGVIILIVVLRKKKKRNNNIGNNNMPNGGPGGYVPPVTPNAQDGKVGSDYDDHYNG